MTKSNAYCCSVVLTLTIFCICSQHACNSIESKITFGKNKLSNKSPSEKENEYFRPWEKYVSSLKPSTSDEVQTKAVKGLLARLLPKYQHRFLVQVDNTFDNVGKDMFKISSPVAANDSRVGIKGTTGVAVAWGILHYLKYYCSAHVSWEANQLELPSPLPKAQVKIAALDRFRYYQNVCTVSYSFAWWRWSQWQVHIDWMALNGINFPLAFTAQEAIWRTVYTRFNFTQQDLDDHFAGPAFLAWGRMGNIQKWGGPLSDSWHHQTLALQQRILARMRNFGMIPILPAFAGHVPSAITRLYPHAKVTRLSSWGKFKNDSYTRTYLLDPSDDLFLQIGAEFIREMQVTFNGTDHVYNCDTFNEMTPPSSEPAYLRRIGKSIFKAMTIADSKAIWVLQGWIFRDHDFWTTGASKALLTSVPQGKMLVLDLTSDVYPEYPRLRSYFGQPFVFCMLHNYGGVNGFYGNVDVLLQHMKEARAFPNVTLVGVGLTPEGINQNYVVYDLMLELAWRLDVNMTEWAMDYAVRRYGCNSSSLKEAWTILMNTLYNCHVPARFHGNSILIQHRPDFSRQNYMWYKASDLLRVWDLFVSAIDENSCQISLERPVRNYALEGGPNFPEVSLLTEEGLMTMMQLNSSNMENYEGNSTYEEGYDSIALRSTFRHDLVDITRQVLQVLGGRIADAMRFSYFIQSPRLVNMTGSLMASLLADLDLLLGTSNDFLLGKWLQLSTTWATNEQEKMQYALNALYQISLWGPNGEIVDYAVKQWNGVVRNYMMPRWNLFRETLLESLQSGNPFSREKFYSLLLEAIEKPFADGKDIDSYANEEQGDLISTVKYIYEKYRPLFGLKKLTENGVPI